MLLHRCWLQVCGDSGGAAVQPGCAKAGDLMDDADAMAALLLATGADGFNGDTMGLIPEAFFQAGQRNFFLKTCRTPRCGEAACRHGRVWSSHQAARPVVLSAPLFPCARALPLVIGLVWAGRSTENVSVAMPPSIHAPPRPTTFKRPATY